MATRSAMPTSPSPARGASCAGQSPTSFETDEYTKLAAFAARPEALPAFRAAPAQDGVTAEALR